MTTKVVCGDLEFAVGSSEACVARVAAVGLVAALRGRFGASLSARSARSFHTSYEDTARQAATAARKVRGASPRTGVASWRSQETVSETWIWSKDEGGWLPPWGLVSHSPVQGGVESHGSAGRVQPPPPRASGHVGLRALVWSHSQSTCDKPSSLFGRTWLGGRIATSGPELLCGRAASEALSCRSGAPIPGCWLWLSLLRGREVPTRWSEGTAAMTGRPGRVWVGRPPWAAALYQTAAAWPSPRWVPHGLQSANRARVRLNASSGDTRRRHGVPFASVLCQEYHLHAGDAQATLWLQ